MSNELIAAIEENPDDVENFRVYGDWLEAQGHPRGQLIAMYFLKERLTDHHKLLYLNKKIAQYITAHQATFLGPLESWMHPEMSQHSVVWRYGFIRGVTLMTEPPLRALLEHPSGRFVRDLHLRLWEKQQAVVDMLAEIAPKTLRDLRLEVWNATADLGALWPRLSKLEELAIEGSEQEYGRIDLPNLRVASLPGDAVVSLGQTPALEHLSLRFTERQRVSDVLALLERTDLPKLTELELHDASFANEIVERLASTPVGRQLREINLDGSGLTNAGAKAWAANPPAQRFEVIRAVRSHVNKHGVAYLQAIAQRVIYRVQDADDDDPE